MSGPRDGDKVAYVGYPGEVNPEIGDRGVILQAGLTGSHVKWASGRRASEIHLVPNEDFVVQGQARLALADSVTMGPAVGIKVRATYEKRGAVGLLNALNAEGHLGAFPNISEDALAFVSNAVRNDPSIQEVLAQLEPDEGDDFIAVASTVLLRDAFGGRD